MRRAFSGNSSVLLKEDDCRIRISALELPLATYTKFKKYRVTEQDVTACIEKEAADYEILLAHNPVYFDAYKNGEQIWCFPGIFTAGLSVCRESEV